MVEYAVLLSLIALALVGPVLGLGQQVGNRFQSITNELSNGGSSGIPDPGTPTPPPTTSPTTTTPPPTTPKPDTGEKPDPNPGTTEKPTPLEGEAYAVYSADDDSLEFFRGDTLPSVGSKSKAGKTVTKVFSDFEDGVNTWDGRPGWSSTGSKLSKTIKYVNFREVVRPRSLYGWFADMNRIRTVDIHKLDTSECTNMALMFFGCSMLNTDDPWTDYVYDLNLSSFDTSKVTDMSQMFEGCPGLRNVDISGWDTSSVTTMRKMFSGDIYLARVGDLSHWDVSRVTNFEEMFNFCRPLSDLGDIGRWDTSSATNMAGMFAGATKVDADLSKWNVSNVTNHKDFIVETNTDYMPESFKSPVWVS